MHIILLKVILMPLLSIVFGCINATQRTPDNQGLTEKMERPKIFILANNQSWLHTSACGNKMVKTAFGRVTKERGPSTHSFMTSPSLINPEESTYPVQAIPTIEYLCILNIESKKWPTGGPDFVSSYRTNNGDVDTSPTKTFILENAEQYSKNI